MTKFGSVRGRTTTDRLQLAVTGSRSYLLGGRLGGVGGGVLFSLSFWPASSICGSSSPGFHVCFARLLFNIIYNFSLHLRNDNRFCPSHYVIIKQYYYNSGCSLSGSSRYGATEDFKYYFIRLCYYF